MKHPCLSCGACCAFYLVGLHWSEAAPELGGITPPELTEPLGIHQRNMLGTKQEKPRCIALQGTIGENAHCGIYPHRPQVCRDVAPAWEFGEPSPQCDRARIAHGLLPLKIDDWVDFQAA